MHNTLLIPLAHVQISYKPQLGPELIRDRFLRMYEHEAPPVIVLVRSDAELELPVLGRRR